LAFEPLDGVGEQLDVLFVVKRGRLTGGAADHHGLGAGFGVPSEQPIPRIEIELR
jgi:hypothetical protein